MREVAEYGQAEMRSSDAFGRLGGEEFVALLPNTEYDEAFEVAQRVRERIETATWRAAEISELTVSVGVSTYKQENYNDFKALLKAADEHLLQAKNAGRNKVI